MFPNPRDSILVELILSRVPHGSNSIASATTKQASTSSGNRQLTHEETLGTDMFHRNDARYRRFTQCWENTSMEVLSMTNNNQSGQQGGQQGGQKHQNQPQSGQQSGQQQKQGGQQGQGGQGGQQDRDPQKPDQQNKQR